MKSSVVKGLEPDEAAEIKQSFVASKRLRKQLVNVFKEKSDTILRLRISDEEYNSPSWPYKQADAVGYQRAISEIISILSD